MTKAYELKQLKVRPVNRDEISRWDDCMRRYHYLGFRQLVGRSLRYVADVCGEWVALLGWSSASKNCGARERYIGWSSMKKYRRLCFIANNSRFLILPWVRQKNLASKVLSLNLKRLSLDFEEVYGHPLYLAETFVDESRFIGTSYIASNWKHVGYTMGYSRVNRKYYRHGEVKAVYVYNLCDRAKELLSGDLIAYDSLLLKNARFVENLINFPIEELLIEIGELTDPRRKEGKRHPLQTVLAIAVCAVLSGCKSYQGIGDWSRSLCDEELKRFGSNRGIGPSEPTIRRVLQRIDAEEFDLKIGQWLCEQRLINNGGSMKRCGIAIDGKTLRGSYNVGQKPMHLLSAVVHKEGIVIGQESVNEKTNEITRTKPLLEKLNIEGATVTADALHTQKDFGSYLVEEKKADFVFIAKENQPGLLEDIKYIIEKKSPERV